jgi:hypothetical protein
MWVGWGAAIDVPARIILGPGRDQQDADGWGDHRHITRRSVGQAPADAHGLGALEQEAAAVLQKHPGQAEPQGGGFPRELLLGFGRPGFQLRIHMHRKAPSSLVADPRPGGHDVGRVLDGQRRPIQELPPLLQIRLHLAAVVAEDK